MSKNTDIWLDIFPAWIPGKMLKLLMGDCAILYCIRECLKTINTEMMTALFDLFIYDFSY